MMDGWAGTHSVCISISFSVRVLAFWSVCPCFCPVVWHGQGLAVVGALGRALPAGGRQGTVRRAGGAGGGRDQTGGRGRRGSAHAQGPGRSVGGCGGAGVK